MKRQELLLLTTSTRTIQMISRSKTWIDGPSNYKSGVKLDKRQQHQPSAQKSQRPSEWQRAIQGQMEDKPNGKSSIWSKPVASSDAIKANSGTGRIGGHDMARVCRLGPIRKCEERIDRKQAKAKTEDNKLLQERKPLHLKSCNSVIGHLTVLDSSLIFQK